MDLFESTRAHQKSSSVFSTLELFVLLVREAHKCGWIRTASVCRIVRRAKKPLRGFLDARLATSTCAHQKASTYTSTLRFLFCNRARLIERVDSNGCGDVAEDDAKTAQWAVFSSAARDIHPRPPKDLKSHSRGWIRTAAAPFIRTISSSARISRTIRTVVTIVYRASYYFATVFRLVLCALIF